MKNLKILNILLLGLLAISAAMPKNLALKHEVEFFAENGLSLQFLFIFGLVQLVGGLLLITAKTRMLGATACAVTFLGSAVMLFNTAQPAFALFSLLPVAMALFVAFARQQTEN